MLYMNLPTVLPSKSYHAVPCVSFGTYLPFNKVSIPKTFPFRRRGLHSIKIKIAQDNTWDMYKITQDRTGIDLDFS